MAYKRKKIDDIALLKQVGKKKFVRYDEGAALYSMGIHSFMELAREAKAVYHVRKIALVNTDIVDEYLECFRDETDDEY